MKYFWQKEKLTAQCVAGSLLLALTAAAPQVLANDAAAQRIRQLENRLQEIQNELIRIKTESAQTTRKVDQIQETSTQTTRKVEQIQQTTQQQKTGMDTGGSDVIEKRTMLFFRGGFARSDEHRNGATLESRVVPLGAQDQADRNAWYVGAGFDFQLTRDTWGLLPKTEVDAELMFEYKQFGHGVHGNALANEPSILAGAPLNPRGVTVNQFTLTAAPKIKFLHFGRFRPWIIPGGLAIHVISPPSESVTYLEPGVMFAGGAEYRLWKDFFVGADARYHLTAGSLDGSKIGGLTVGGYLGIGF
ncbi:porin family protein [Nitrosomonas sp. JL21]|uniref:porin family protein n=1 Tax=Nitrosomonas sp. JL21 TaxID=153949 RepID=UPI00136B077C|nr:porin family protein [Nitrosomonas sp. JL21]MBL8496753.1 porin family protein [Nitrosomonas sp.]MCC7090861.1 porin family protein [Nitrosomonas sp.]MXS76508.1 porin family protein [Nitrosomonas sp. JL21]